MKKTSIFLAFATLLVSCGKSIPTDFSTSGSAVEIFPDYTGVTVPANIAPTNFSIEKESQAYVTVLSSGNEKAVISGQKVKIPRRKWEKLTQGDRIDVTIYTKDNGKWTAFAPFQIKVSHDLIDQFISYRALPSASVESYEKLALYQRDLTSYREKVIYSNQMIQTESSGQCVNCHSYKNYRTDNMQFHVRHYLGATVLVDGGKLRKLSTKTDSTITAAFYPCWHPTHDFIAYSNDKVHQSLHTLHHNRIEVLDEESDIILYNLRTNKISVIENDSDYLETYPAWSPDGKTLYYSSARYIAPYDRSRRDRIFLDKDSIQYNLLRKSFNPDTEEWGESEMVYNAVSHNKSVTWPRVSPDGRWLLANISQHSVFPINQSDADLCLIDLTNDSLRVLRDVSSTESESYHEWSSTGKWILFSTRREDGSRTRLYIAHFNGDGTFDKPFALPQRNPDFNREFLLAFNIGVFMIEPVSISPRQFARFIKNGPVEQVGYTSKKSLSAK